MHFVVSRVPLVTRVPACVHRPRPIITALARFGCDCSGRQYYLAVKGSSVMASAASVLAVVRAAAPSFGSPQDTLAFAVHAAVLSSGFRLVAVGDQAQLEGIAADAPDAAVAGWNSSSDQYTFAYVAEEGAGGSAATAAKPPAKLLMKALVLGNVLLTTLATDSSTTEPKVLELAVEDYINITSSSSGGGAGGLEGTGAAGGSSSIAKTYKNLNQLTKILATALSSLMAPGTTNIHSSGSQKKQKTEAAAEAGGSSAASTGAPGQNPESSQDINPNYDPLRIGPPMRPFRVGHDDVMPLHLGAGPGEGMLPGAPPLLGPTGGGMHVGPGHPFFADRMRHPELMPGRGLGRGGMPTGPGGVRWDPINPEGLEGWHPDDFQRPRTGMGRGIDPDISQPGPGRGTDWDNMFG